MQYLFAVESADSLSRWKARMGREIDERAVHTIDFRALRDKRRAYVIDALSDARVHAPLGQHVQFYSA